MHYIRTIEGESNDPRSNHLHGHHRWLPVLHHLEGLEMKTSEIAGWLGMVLLQGATLPAMLNRLYNPESAILPPVSMVLLVWCGLALYFWRAFAQKDYLYMVSNGIGLFLNSVLMALIIFPAG
jgi:lysylphosphatidylglycerol synthetase-like protein (DUF2156 family)